MVDWVKVGLNTLTVVGGLMGAALGLLYFLQEKIIYVPRLPGISNEYPYMPDAFGLSYEDAYVVAGDGVRLHAWMMWAPHLDEAARRARPTVIFFQENAGNMAFRLHFMNALARHLNVSAFIFSYRGYGRSEGTPSEQGLQLDAEAAVEHVLRRSDIDPTQVVLFGRSLGGAVAAYAASRLQRHVSGLVLENTFTSIVDLVPHTLPFLRPLVGPGRPFNFLVRNHWDSRSRLAQLADLPVFFLSAMRDEMLPPQQMQELFDLHPAEPWRIVYFDDGRHLDAYDSHAAQYWPALRLFLSTLGPAQPLPPPDQERSRAAPQQGDALRPPQEQEMAAAATTTAAEGQFVEARKER